MRMKTNRKHTENIRHCQFSTSFLHTMETAGHMITTLWSIFRFYVCHFYHCKDFYLTLRSHNTIFIALRTTMEMKRGRREEQIWKTSKEERKGERSKSYPSEHVSRFQLETFLSCLFSKQTLLCYLFLLLSFYLNFLRKFLEPVKCNNWYAYSEGVQKLDKQVSRFA